MAGENKCESCWNDYGDRRRAEVREKHRRRDAESLPPPAVQGKQCANPNCAILLPSAGQLCKWYCLTCYKHKGVHKGQAIPREMCEKSKKQLDEEHQKFADRRCIVVACGVALPAGLKVIQADVESVITISRGIRRTKLGGQVRWNQAWSQGIPSRGYGRWRNLALTHIFTSQCSAAQCRRMR